jgi:hypothetical protein
LSPTTVRPGDLWQWYGTACVVCGHRFDPSEHPTEVGRIGLDQHALRACPDCADQDEQGLPAVRSGTGSQEYRAPLLGLDVARRLFRKASRG